MLQTESSTSTESGGEVGVKPQKIKRDVLPLRVHHLEAPSFRSWSLPRSTRTSESKRREEDEDMEVSHRSEAMSGSQFAPYEYDAAMFNHSWRRLCILRYTVPLRQPPQVAE